MKWLILRGPRFYDVTGILVLTLSVDSLSHGISMVRDLYHCLFHISASILFLIAGSNSLSIKQTLEIDLQNKPDSKEEYYQKLIESQHDIGLKKRIAMILLCIIISITLLITANLSV